MTTTTRDTGRAFLAFVTPPVFTLVARTAAPELFPSTSLGLDYPAPSGSLNEAAWILLANARVAALVIGATILVTSAPMTRTPLTVIVALVAAINGAQVCIAIADDGTRAAIALLPHGPVELLAFSRLAALFLAARRHPVTPRTIAIATVTGVALLAVAALLEVTPT